MNIQELSMCDFWPGLGKSSLFAQDIKSHTCAKAKDDQVCFINDYLLDCKTSRSKTEV